MIRRSIVVTALSTPLVAVGLKGAVALSGQSISWPIAGAIGLGVALGSVATAAVADRLERRS